MNKNIADLVSKSVHEVTGHLPGSCEEDMYLLTPAEIETFFKRIMKEFLEEINRNKYISSRTCVEVEEKLKEKFGDIV